MITLLKTLRNMRGTRAGKALAVKPIYKKLMKSYLRRNAYDFEGFKLFLNPDDSIITDSLVSGDYETMELHLLEKLIRPGDVILDIGANIGLYSIYCAKATGAAGHVYCFEPEPVNFSFLKRNISLNKLSNITPSDTAVSSQEGEHTFYLNPLNKGDHRLHGDEAHTSTITVRTITIDGYLKGRTEKVDLIKMDIQGAEMQALLGMKEILSAAGGPCLLMEFWPYGLNLSGSDPKTLLGYLESLGFHFYTIEEADNKLQPGNIADILKRAKCVEGEDYKFENYLNLLCLKNTERMPESL